MGIPVVAVQAIVSQTCFRAPTRSPLRARGPAAFSIIAQVGCIGRLENTIPVRMLQNEQQHIRRPMYGQICDQHYKMEYLVAYSVGKSIKRPFSDTH